MSGAPKMIFTICFLVVVAILISALLQWKANIPSACTGNCRQGRQCDCMEEKDEKIN